MIFQIFNGPSPTTAAQAVVTTGTAIKTLLQVKLGAAVPYGKIIEWGISFDGSAAATPIKCELLETGTVFATVTAHVNAGLVNLSDPDSGIDATTSIFSVGTAASGYTATAEGTITATRVFDAQLVAPTNQYAKQFPLGREPVIDVGTSMRIRVTAGAAVNALAYMTIEI